MSCTCSHHVVHRINGIGSEEDTIAITIVWSSPSHLRSFLFVEFFHEVLSIAQEFSPLFPARGAVGSLPPEISPIMVGGPVSKRGSAPRPGDVVDPDPSAKRIKVAKNHDQQGGDREREDREVLPDPAPGNDENHGPEEQGVDAEEEAQQQREGKRRIAVHLPGAARDPEVLPDADHDAAAPQSGAGVPVAELQHTVSVTVFFGAAGESAEFSFSADAEVTVEQFKRYLLREENHAAAARACWWGESGRPPYKVFALLQEEGGNRAEVVEGSGKQENDLHAGAADSSAADGFELSDSSSEKKDGFELSDSTPLVDGAVYRTVTKRKSFDKNLDLAYLVHADHLVWLYQHEWEEHVWFKKVVAAEQGWLWDDLLKVGVEWNRGSVVL